MYVAISIVSFFFFKLSVLLIFAFCKIKIKYKKVSKPIKLTMNHSSQEQPKKESGSTDEDATESTPTPAAVATSTNLICSFCDTKLPLDKFKKCNCKTTIYCRNASCQKEHWKVHKLEHHKLCKALNAVKNEGEEGDDSKSGSKNKTSSPTIRPKPIIQEEKDECPICLDKLSTDMSEFERFTCCGKGIHKHCSKQLGQVKSKNIREYCPLCRTKNPTRPTAFVTFDSINTFMFARNAWKTRSLTFIFLVEAFWTITANCCLII